MGTGKQRISLAVRVPLIALAAEREHAPVVAELEHAQAEVVPEPGHPHAQLAVPLRTKLVTAAHRQGLAPLLAAVDLAAAAETTREPAAAEAAVAWEVAE